jgi:hypothetical protein
MAAGTSGWTCMAGFPGFEGGALDGAFGVGHSPRMFTTYFHTSYMCIKN